MEFKPTGPEEVAGERYVYKFVCEPEALFSLAFPGHQHPTLKAKFDRPVGEEDTVPLSHLDESPAYLPELAGPARPFGPKGGLWQLLPGHRGLPWVTEMNFSGLPGPSASSAQGRV
ncbi:ETS translocation variant 4 [Myotis brandtii]|uniref:ETS translocation variant 4 n=1 Tax=Myotis brandtii TaxID=109478 RepID=S7NDT5_MYOBR|nr:ETS translocation variant 4 [Myotis brandtii]